MDPSEPACCDNCVGDPFLKARIRDEGTVAECERCGETRKAVSENDLEWWIKAILEEHFVPGEGDDIAAIIADIAGLPEDHAEDIADSLASTAGYRAGGDDTFYSSDEGYVLDGRSTGEGLFAWRRFAESVRAEARFFNRTAETWLDRIFGPLGDDRTWHGKAVVKEMMPGDAAAGFFRARHVASVGKAWDVLAHPSAQLGPLPQGQGKAGRMNAPGVSVFYGALDAETCTAEIRPPVGSVVLSARFDLLRPIRVLDLDLLGAVQAHGSHFDPAYHEKRERAAFLRAFGRLIAEPVMPDDEAFGYLPTQIVADYLAQRLDPVIDGIIYRSTQTGGKGRNIVLFNRSARVELRDEAHPVGPVHDFGPDPLAALSDGPPAPILDDFPPPDGQDDRPVTLRLVMDSLEVAEVQETLYKAPRQSVETWRWDLEEREREQDWP